MSLRAASHHVLGHRTCWQLFICERCISSSGGTERTSINDFSSDDYQFLHRSSVPSMHFQKSLLRLPIPDLDKTCSRYLLSQKALLDDINYSETEAAVQEFRTKSGPPLQEQLKSWDKNNKHTNYVSGPWFDMYLKDRVPVVLNYNPFLTFKFPEEPNNDPVVRASNMLVSSARFLRTFRAGVLEPEVYHLNPDKSNTLFYRRVVGLAPQMLASYASYAFKAFPLDMSQYGNLLNSTRIPRPHRDVLSSNDSARHVLVMKNGNFYVFDILDSNGCIYPPSHLHACVAYIVADTSPRPAHPLGYLTSENRDTWAKVRQELVAAGNGEALEAIDHAAYNIVFDSHDVGADPQKCFRTFLYGDGGNRWFDKSFSVIYSGDGIAALNFEHSWGDGVAVMRYFNEVSEDVDKHCFIGHDSRPANIDPTRYVRKLEWRLPASVEAAVQSAKASYEVATSKVAVNILETTLVNKKSCKQHKISPDAVAQLGLQVAYRMLYGGVAATYESCSTSAFKHGRTETVRPATLETKAFSEAVCGSDVPNAARLKSIMHECSAVHNKLTKEAAMGQGFDRHLFGLRNMAQQSGLELPVLYRDPAYARINHNILSTSTLPSNNIAFGGFAPVVKDGFGVGYQMQDDMFGIVLSSYPPHRDGAGFIECATKAYGIIADALAAN
ncbi:Acyltransferase ChoActase/COT/CPT [Trinorchestia longiramus]|nr:Acyltransferase ChoActase/COT/CPT [Trinorchestia longiramus]